MIINPIYNINAPNLLDNTSILELENLEDKISKWNTYTYNGKPVPRVSDILKECVGREYLTRWAAKLGDNYQKESSRTLYTGTMVHEMIEHFLYYGSKKEIDIKSFEVKRRVENCYHNFLKWYHDKQELGYKITPISIESITSNPWFGGTIDCKMQFEKDGISRVYIIDFKTSKAISTDYLIQTYAYYWSEEWNRFYNNSSLIPLDGIGVIRVDKEGPIYEDLIIDFNDPSVYEFKQQIDYALGSIINWYYNIQNISVELKHLRRIRKDGFIYVY